METNFSASAKKYPILCMLKTVLVFAFFHLNHFYGFGNSKTYHFEVIQNRLILKVEIKGDTFNFAFDTGSYTSIIDSVSARDLEIPFTSKKSINTVGGRLDGYFTNDTTFNIVPRMTWMIAPIKNFDIDSTNLRIHGIIGASRIIIKHLVDINFKTKTLTIDPEIDLNNFTEINLINAIKKEQLGMEEYIPQYPTVITSVSIGNHFFDNVKLIIDSGCKYDIAIVANDSLLIKSFKAESRNYKTLNNSNIDIMFSGVQLLDKYLKNINTISPIFYVGNDYENNLIALLGLPYLKRYNRVIINNPTKKIYFVE